MRLARLLAVLAFLLAPTASAAVTVTVKKSTLRVKQTSSEDTISVNNAAAFGMFVVTEGSNIQLHPARRNLVIEMLSGSSDALVVDLDRALVGKLTIRLGDGDRTLSFTGDANFVGSGVKITGGTGEQVVMLADDAPLTVGRDLLVDLGAGMDSTVASAGLMVAGDLTLRGVNGFANNAECSIGGDVLVDVAKEMESSNFDNNAFMLLFGDMTYRGSNHTDDVFLDSSPRIDGDVDVSLKQDFGDGDDQDVTLLGSHVRGHVRVRCSASVDGATFQTSAGTQIGGDVDLDYGSGANLATLLGTWASRRVAYDGAGGSDEVIVDLDAPGADVRIALEGGPDLLTLEATTVVDRLRIDFGSGTDTFTDLIGPPYPFDVDVDNLP